MKYEIEFKRTVLEFYDNNNYTLAEVGKMFIIDPSTISYWRKRKKDTGDVQNKKPVVKHNKMDKEELKKMVEEQPDMYQREFAEHFGVRPSSVCKAFKVLGIKRKKKLYYTKKEMKRNELNT
jgi:transposase